MSDVDIEGLRALADAATPGPWRAINGKGCATVQASDCAVYINVDRERVHIAETIERWQDDAAFIAAARTAVPALLDQIDRLTRELATSQRFLAAEIEHKQRLGAQNVEVMRKLDVKYPHGVMSGVDRVITERDAARAECERWLSCFICIECGRGAADEDGCCVTCGRDCLMLDNGRVANKGFADALEADIERQTAERIAAFVESTITIDSRYRMVAADIRAGLWRGGK